MSKPLCAPSIRAHPHDIKMSQAQEDDAESRVNDNGGDSTGKTAKGISKTEEIAAKLGQSRESMEQSREKVFTEQKFSNRKKYGLASVATILAVVMVLFEKWNPSGGSSMLRYLQESSLDTAVIGNGRPTVVEFSALWCESCKRMAPSMFQLENEYVNRVNFVIVDGENSANSKVMEDFRVDGIPQFSLLDSDGNNLGNLIGFVPKQVLSENIDALLDGRPQLPHPGLSLEDLF